MQLYTVLVSQIRIRLISFNLKKQHYKLARTRALRQVLLYYQILRQLKIQCHDHYFIIATDVNLKWHMLKNNLQQIHTYVRDMSIWLIYSWSISFIESISSAQQVCAASCICTW